MIISFKDKETERLFYSHYSRKLPPDIQIRAFNKLVGIEEAMNLESLKIPFSNHLEKLTGDLVGKWSIRINDKWRIIFRSVNDGKDFSEVEIIDYH